MNTLSHRVAEALNKIGKSNEELAQILGVNKNTISTYRHKKGDLKGIVLERLTQKLGYNPIWLLTGEGEMFVKKEAKQEELVDPKLMEIVSPRHERTETDLGDMQKRVDVLRWAAKFDRRLTLNAMISLREYLDKQIKILSE